MQIKLRTFGELDSLFSSAELTESICLGSEQLLYREMFGLHRDKTSSTSERKVVLRKTLERIILHFDIYSDISIVYAFNSVKSIIIYICGLEDDKKLLIKLDGTAPASRDPLTIYTDISSSSETNRAYRKLFSADLFDNYSRAHEEYWEV